MQLTTHKEKLNFLQGLYGHISRMHSQDITESDKTLNLSAEALKKQGEHPLDKQLPSSFIVTTRLGGRRDPGYTVKALKLQILKDLYNTVSETIASTDTAIDLDQLFTKFKIAQNNYMRKSGFEGSIDEVLKLHRTPGKRSGIGKMFSPRPESEKFLEKYDFFNASGYDFGMQNKK